MKEGWQGLAEDGQRLLLALHEQGSHRAWPWALPDSTFLLDQAEPLEVEEPGLLFFHLKQLVSPSLHRCRSCSRTPCVPAAGQAAGGEDRTQLEFWLGTDDVTSHKCGTALGLSFFLSTQERIMSP